MKSKALLALIFVIMFGFVAFGSSYSYNNWGYSRASFYGSPSLPVINYHPTYVNFYSSSGHVTYQPVSYRPSSFRFVFLG